MPTSSITLRPVQSSLIASYGYDASRQILGVAFVRAPDVVYEYEAVSPDVAQALDDAESKGSFIQRQIIKGGYNYARFDPAVPDPEAQQ